MNMYSKWEYQKEQEYIKQIAEGKIKPTKEEILDIARELYKLREREYQRTVSMDIS